ncbi:ketosamine-3-kinase-like [Porites lutea]|uniref:ketosamine-3-kinase-like n=1 Tax=Porites lutea TaxID=51062 RepID=UPI003CC6A74A
MARSLQVSKLEEILQKELNTTKLKPLRFATGGCINEGQSYLTENGKIFVKVNEKSEATKMFEGEFLSLETIYPTNTVRVPKPIKIFDHPAGSGSIFIMEHIDMKGLRKYQAQLGAQLGRLHMDNIKKLQKAEIEENRIGKGKDPTAIHKFGFPAVTCCGYIGQNNEWCDDWVTFYTNRLQQQMDLIDREYGDSEARSLWSSLKLKIPEFFKDVPDIKPSLLHGDLWSGNAAETDDGPVVFDPASFYGHHEFDLAIAGMFGGFSEAFYDAYHKEIPKEKGFNKRHQLYQLFHHLNHWNHFGTGYKSSSLAIIHGLLQNS